MNKWLVSGGVLGFMASSAFAGDWITDQNGCKAWNNNPQPGESITWSGKCLNGYADGFGTQKWSLRGNWTDTYTGGMRAGKFDFGTFKYANGAQYEGNWLDNKASGIGTYTWANGDIYLGNHINGRSSGKGSLTWADGSRYVGDFVDGRPSGKGRHISASGERTEGDWLNGKIISSTADKAYAEGYIKEKIRGCFVFNYFPGNEATWDGDCDKDNYASGYGTLWSRDGMFSRAKFSGHLSNGRVSNGMLFLGKTVTYAVTMSDKFDWHTLFDGAFVDGTLAGKGKITSAKHNFTHEGSWGKDGKTYEKGIVKYGNGQIYEGEFDQGKAIGRGIFKYPNGESCEFLNSKVVRCSSDSIAQDSGNFVNLAIGALVVGAVIGTISEKISSSRSSSSSSSSSGSSSSGRSAPCYQLKEVDAKKNERERWKISCSDGVSGTIYREYGEKKFAFGGIGVKREGIFDAMGGYSTRDDAAKVACGCRD